MTTSKKVTIETIAVGQNFGTCAVLRDARTGRKVGETATRPYGFTAAAMADAEALASGKGWTVVSDEDQ